MSDQTLAELSTTELEIPTQVSGHNDVKGDPSARRPPARRQYAKVMGKMGLKPEPEISRITIRKAKNVSFVIAAPEVYKYPGTDAYIIFGEPSFGEDTHEYQKAAQQFTGAAHESENQTIVEEIDEEQTAEGLEEKDIELVMSQAMVSRNKAIKALRENDGDIVNTIMALTM